MSTVACATCNAPVSCHLEEGEAAPYVLCGNCVDHEARKADASSTEHRVPTEEPRVHVGMDEALGEDETVILVAVNGAVVGTLTCGEVSLSIHGTDCAAIEFDLVENGLSHLLAAFEEMAK